MIEVDRGLLDSLLRDIAALAGEAAHITASSDER
jgi:hypothetical protein